MMDLFTNNHVYKTPDDLPEGFEDYVETSETGLTFFKHPLFITMFPFITPVPLTKLIETGQVEVKKHLAAGNVTGAVFAHERPYRGTFLYEHNDHPSFSEDGSKFWKLLADVWTDTESPHINSDMWLDLFSMEYENRESLMDKDELVKFKELCGQETVYVYRGFHADPSDDLPSYWSDSLSWTLDPDVAIKFAKRWRPALHKSYVVEGTFRSNDMIAFFAARNESEIIAEGRYLELGDLKEIE